MSSASSSAVVFAMWAPFVIDIFALPYERIDTGFGKVPQYVKKMRLLPHGKK
jgi:hypothetical protein